MTDISFSAGAGEFVVQWPGATSGLDLASWEASILLKAGAGQFVQHFPGATSSFSLAQAYTGLTYADGVSVRVSTGASITYRPPISIPPAPVIGGTTPATPVQATGYVVRPYYGMLADPDHEPTIVDGKPT